MFGSDCKVIESWRPVHTLRGHTGGKLIKKCCLCDDGTQYYGHNMIGNIFLKKMPITVRFTFTHIPFICSQKQLVHVTQGRCVCVFVGVGGGVRGHGFEWGRDRVWAGNT